MAKAGDRLGILLALPVGDLQSSSPLARDDDLVVPRAQFDLANVPSCLCSTSCQLGLWLRILGENDLVDGNHASFGFALHLSELLNQFAIGWVAEENVPRSCPGSGIRRGRLDPDGDLVDPIEYYDRPKVAPIDDRTFRKGFGSIEPLCAKEE